MVLNPSSYYISHSSTTSLLRKWNLRVVVLVSVLPCVSAWSPGGHGLWRTPPWSLPVSKGHKTNCRGRGDSGERHRTLSHQMTVLPIWKVWTLLFFPRCCCRMDCWCCTLPWSCPPRREQQLSNMLFGFKGELVFSHWKVPLSCSITGHSWNSGQGLLFCPSCDSRELKLKFFQMSLLLSYSCLYVFTCLI